MKYLYGATVEETVIVDGDENVVVVVDVVVVHSISHPFSSDASESLHLVPLPAGSCTMVLFLCCMPRCKPSTHPDSLTSQSDHSFHAPHSQSTKINNNVLFQTKMMRLLNLLYLKSDYLSG